MVNVVEHETLNDLYERWLKNLTAFNNMVDDAVARGQDHEQATRHAEAVLKGIHHWPKALVEPIARALEAQGVYGEVEVMGPFGLGARCHLYGFENSAAEAPVAMLALQPNLRFDEGRGESVLSIVDYDCDTGELATGALAEANQLARPIEPIPMGTATTDLAFWLTRMRYVSFRTRKEVG